MTSALFLDPNSGRRHVTPNVVQSPPFAHPGKCMCSHRHINNKEMESRDISVTEQKTLYTRRLKYYFLRSCWLKFIVREDCKELKAILKDWWWQGWSQC